MWGDEGPPRFLADMHRLGCWRDVTAVEDYEMRPDGLPRYRMSRKLGPLLPAVSMTSEYSEFDRPRRAVNHAVDTPLRGDFVATYEPIRRGTRITWHWEVQAENPLVNALLMPLRPLLVRSLQRNLHEYGTAVARSQVGRLGHSRAGRTDPGVGRSGDE